MKLNFYRFLKRKICLIKIFLALVLVYYFIFNIKFFLFKRLSRLNIKEDLQIYHRPSNLSTPGVVDDIIGMKPLPLSSRFKNPCWYEKQDGKTLTLKCLPYFYLVGVDKCGTTDLFLRLAKHPDLLKITAVIGKETHWWSWRRFGYDVFTHNSRFQSFDEYLRVFDKAAQQLNDTSEKSCCGIIGEGSPTVFWDFTGWPLIAQNRWLKQPIILTPHCISHLTPKVKFILMLRNPVDRLYSDYLFLNSHAAVTPQSFHEGVQLSWDLFINCQKTSSKQLCLFNKTLHMMTEVRLLIGMYSDYLKEWLKVFPRKQFFIIRTEDYKNDMSGTLKRIFEFLEMKPLSMEKLEEITSGKHIFERSKEKKKLGPMLEKTRSTLYNIYKPSIEELAAMLGDERFLWHKR